MTNIDEWESQRIKKQMEFREEMKQPILEIKKEDKVEEPEIEKEIQILKPQLSVIEKKDNLSQIKEMWESLTKFEKVQFLLSLGVSKASCYRMVKEYEKLRDIRYEDRFKSVYDR